MLLSDIRERVDSRVYEVVRKEGVDALRPCQERAIAAGLLDGRSLLVCTPTASGKTLVAELAMATSILAGGKAAYIVPLKALASEKRKEFSRTYGALFRIALSIGDMDEADSHLADYDLIICTAEKLDSLLRHHAPWARSLTVVVADEIHLLNDPGRGPTLEILLTMLRSLRPDLQLIGLSATIGNPQELAAWLGAELIVDSWRPVELKQGVHLYGKTSFS